MKYVIVDYPHGNELSLVAINNNETVALINTWRTGELHREIYNAIIDMSTRRKGEFVNTIYFLPFTEQIKKFRKNGDVVGFSSKSSLDLQAKHWLFSEYHMDITSAENLLRHIQLTIAKQTDKGLAILDDDPIETLVTNMQTYGVHAQESTNHIIEMVGEKYFIVPAVDAEAVMTVDILCTPELWKEGYCRYCGKLYTDSAVGIYCSPSCKTRYNEQKDWPFEDRATAHKSFIKRYIDPILEERRESISGYSAELKEAKRKKLPETLIAETERELQNAQRKFDIMYNAREHYIQWQKENRQKAIEDKQNELERYIQDVKTLLDTGLPNQNRVPEWHVGQYGNHKQEFQDAWKRVLQEEEAIYK